MSSDPIEVLRQSARELRGLLAEMDPPRKPATGGRKLDADQLRHTLGNMDAALASLSAPKPESAEAAGGYDPSCPDCKGTGDADSGGVHPWGAPAYIACHCHTAPPRPEASAPVGVEARASFEAWARPKWRHPEDFDQRIGSPSGTYNNFEAQAAWSAWQAALAQQPAADRGTEFATIAASADCPACGEAGPCECKGYAQQPAAHPDDAAVDAFAAAMKEKLAAARAKGRGGWQDQDLCPQQRLSDMLRAHVEKGDPRDVANFAMFLHQRGESILPAQQPAAVDEAMVERAYQAWRKAVLGDVGNKSAIKIALAAALTTQQGGPQK